MSKIYTIKMDVIANDFPSYLEGSSDEDILKYIEDEIANTYVDLEIDLSSLELIEVKED